MNISKMTQWRCKKKHVLGVVVHERNGNRRWERLILFRHAVDLSANEPVDIDVIANIDGTMLDVSCDVPGCGAVRSWFATGQAQGGQAQGGQVSGSQVSGSQVSGVRYQEVG